MVAPATSAPPAVGVKANVAATPVFPATRSLAATVNDTEVTASPIAPDETPTEAVGSALVCTVTVPPALTPPMVSPDSVIVTAVLAASAAPPVVSTMDVAPGAPGDSVVLAADSVAVGVAEAAKKPWG